MSEDWYDAYLELDRGLDRELEAFLALHKTAQVGETLGAMAVRFSQWILWKLQADPLKRDEEYVLAFQFELSDVQKRFATLALAQSPGLEHGPIGRLRSKLVKAKSRGKPLVREPRVPADPRAVPRRSPLEPRCGNCHEVVGTPLRDPINDAFFCEHCGREVKG